MSDIPHWKIPPGYVDYHGAGLTTMDVEVVTYADHLAAVAATRAESYAEFVRRHHYDTVRADGIAEGVKAARDAVIACDPDYPNLISRDVALAAIDGVKP